MVDLVQKKMRTPPKPSSSSSKKAKAKTSKTKKGKGGSSTTEAPDASQTGEATGKSKGPKFMTINGDQGMPSEEEILKMVREAKGDGDEVDGHDEL